MARDAQGRWRARRRGRWSSWKKRFQLSFPTSGFHSTWEILESRDRRSYRKLFLRHCCKFDLDSPSPPSLPAVLLPGRSGSWHRPHACLLRSRLCKATAGLSRPILPTLAPGRVSLNLKKGTSKPTSVNCHVNFDANNVQIMTKIANHAL